MAEEPLPALPSPFLCFFTLISLDFRTYKVPLLGRSGGEGRTWMGRLNKRNNGFYCGAGSSSPTHPWHGVQLSVERPIRTSEVDLADYKLETWLHFLSLSLALTLPLQRVSSQLDGETKEREWKKGMLSACP